MYIGKEKERMICSHKILLYFKDRDRQLYQDYIESKCTG